MESQDNHFPAQWGVIFALIPDRDYQELAIRGRAPNMTFAIVRDREDHETAIAYRAFKPNNSTPTK